MSSNREISSSSISEQLQSPSIKRNFQGNTDRTPTTLHVLQWNTLAQGLSNPVGNFIRVKNETVAFEARKWRILEQIVTRQPDLCGLEEVDTYECFLQHQIPKNGYTCFYVPKSKSPCFAFQNDVANFKGPDGLLLCYKTEKFEEIQRYHCEAPLVGTEGKQFYAVLELKHKPSSVRLIFAVTHLKAKAPFAHVRQKQAECLIKQLSEKHSEVKHIIITGDFNGEPVEPFYSLVRQAGFSSAYRTLLNDQEPLFTTWKFREHNGIEQEQCRCIDYIFYKPDAFSPVAILKLPTKEEIGKNGLPSDQYPSDHLALETIFQILT